MTPLLWNSNYDMIEQHGEVEHAFQRPIRVSMFSASLATAPLWGYSGLNSATQHK